ncbi:hypothetical protein GDO81_025166, partial [Engystomops pustulosus]
PPARVGAESWSGHCWCLCVVIHTQDSYRITYIYHLTTDPRHLIFTFPDVSPHIHRGDALSPAISCIGYGQQCQPIRRFQF